MSNKSIGETLEDLQETLADLLLLNDFDKSITLSVYSMTYEEYIMLSNKL
jgi:hypothetical protein